MGVCTIFMVIWYLRPSEGFGIRRRDLQRPVRGLATKWQLLLFPEERQDRSKTFAANDSVEVHCPWLPWFDEITPMLAEGNPDAVVFNFDYPTYLKVWNRCRQTLAITAVPYQGRHSGPSIDAALGVRSRSEIQARGRSKALASVLRYEQRARLLKTFNALPAALQSHCLECERRLQGLFLGGHRACDLVAPRTHGWLQVSAAAS